MKNYKILFDAPTIKGEGREVELSVGQTKQIDDWSVTLISISKEPTSKTTGSAWIETVSALGRHHRDLVLVAKIKTNPQCFSEKLC